MNRDSIDFGTMNITKLFRKLFIPTLLGMVFSAVFVITDGIFVGQGIGSDALAAINITAPIFLVNTGIALMFGIGASVVASIHLSRGKIKVARINITQAVIICSLFIIALVAATMCNIEGVARWLGCSDRLLPLSAEYMMWFAPFLPFSTLLNSGLFYIRLDGSVNYAMFCNIIAAAINMFLDFLLIIILDLGMFGAAIATSIGYVIGATLILIYLLQKKRTLHLCSIKLSRKSMLLTARNVGYMCRLGFSTLLCQVAVAIMMFRGNIEFMNYLGEDGVAAYSIACYLFPIAYMANNAIAQSAQPIMSYNYGAGKDDRVRATLKIALITALGFGTAAFLIISLFAPQVSMMFVPYGSTAYNYGVEGLPLFALGFLFFGINVVCIGYFQSIERESPSNIITIVRGYILVLLCFWLMPQIWGFKGLWLAVPTSDFLTLFVVLAMYIYNKRKRVMNFRRGMIIQAIKHMTS